jgi:hypothetical protein
VTLHFFDRLVPGGSALDPQMLVEQRSVERSVNPFDWGLLTFVVRCSISSSWRKQLPRRSKVGPVRRRGN